MNPSKRSQASAVRERLILVDGNSLLHRAYHAIPLLTSRDKAPTNAVYGFATMLHSLLNDYRPSHIIVCFDRPEPTFRKKMFKEYQVQRPEADESLISQFALARDFLDAASIVYAEKAGYEADDLIGTLSLKAKRKHLKTLILTADRDITQLVDTWVNILLPKKGLREYELVTTDKVKDMMGVNPEQIVDYKALAGDSSDNYKGVTGIGPKTAVSLLDSYTSLHNLYAHVDEVENPRIRALLREHKDDAEMSYKLATIKRDVPVNIRIASSKFKGYNGTLKDFFEHVGFRSLIPRFFPTHTVQKQMPSPSKGEKLDGNDTQQKLF